jgi:gas vesicle protein
MWIALVVAFFIIGILIGLILGFFAGIRWKNDSLKEMQALLKDQANSIVDLSEHIHRHAKRE